MPLTEAAGTAVRLAHAFLDLVARMTPSPRRMGTLVATVGAEAVFAATGLAAAASANPAPADPPHPAVGWLGMHAVVGWTRRPTPDEEPG